MARIVTVHCDWCGEPTTEVGEMNVLVGERPRQIAEETANELQLFETVALCHGCAMKLVKGNLHAQPVAARATFVRSLREDLAQRNKK